MEGIQLIIIVTITVMKTNPFIIQMTIRFYEG
jgi:hypothetical protein